MTNFLELLEPTERTALLARAERRTFAPGTELIDEHGPTDRLLIIRTGTARVAKDHLGTRVTLSRVAPGEVLGELSFLDGLPASATVVAEDTVTADVIDGPALRTLLGRDPDLARNLYRALAITLAGRLRSSADARVCVPALGIG